MTPIAAKEPEIVEGIVERAPIPDSGGESLENYYSRVRLNPKRIELLKHIRKYGTFPVSFPGVSRNNTDDGGV